MAAQAIEGVFSGSTLAVPMVQNPIMPQGFQPNAVVAPLPPLPIAGLQAQPQTAHHYRCWQYMLCQPCRAGAAEGEAAQGGCMVYGTETTGFLLTGLGVFGIALSHCECGLAMILGSFSLGLGLPCCLLGEYFRH